MSKTSKSADKNHLDETKRLMARLAAMPHKPHVDKAAKADSKKRRRPPVKKNRRPQEG